MKREDILFWIRCLLYNYTRSGWSDFKKTHQVTTHLGVGEVGCSIWGQDTKYLITHLLGTMCLHRVQLQTFIIPTHSEIPDNPWNPAIFFHIKLNKYDL